MKDINDSFDATQLRIDLQISDANIEGAMTEQAALYGFYAGESAKCAYKYDRARIKADIIRAKTYKRIKSLYTAKGRKISEGLLESEVILSDEYQKVMELVAQYKMQAAIAKESLEALKQRRDMLVQKGKAALEERKGELYLKEPSRLRSRHTAIA